MTRIEEEYLAFEFGDRWRVFKPKLNFRLTSHVEVESMDRQMLPDIKVSNLPRP